MPKKKNKNRKDENLTDEVNIDEEESSLASFTKRSLPSEKEVEEFDEVINEEISEDEKEEDVEDGLSEIYQDDNGKMVDVKKLDRKKRHSFLYWFFILLSSSLIIFSLVFYLYENYYLDTGTDATAVDFSLRGETEVLAGEEFYYTVHYKNLSNVSLENAAIELTYPENFIFIESDPVISGEKNNVWNVGSISPQHIGKIRIKGKIVAPKDSVNVLLANLNYSPENFSSDFNKESSITTVVKSTGLDIGFDYIPNALVGEENEIIIRYNAENENYINDYRIVFEQQENVEVSGLEQSGDSDDNSKKAKFDLIRPGVWRINEVLSGTRELSFKFKFTEKIKEKQKLSFNFEKKENDEHIVFLKKNAEFEIMKSDLNLVLIINGSREDHGVDAGETLNYSIVYNNKGETEMKNVVIMAVLDSEYLDWNSLSDELKGKESGNTISWTKEQIPEFESLPKHKEGSINFSIDLKNIEEIEEVGDEGDYQVKSYAQFSVGESKSSEDEDKEAEEEEEKSDSHSNTIISSINSNLELTEEVRYFSEDNIPVGTGPHPPKVEKKTEYKVYWSLSNSLHELGDLKVAAELPRGVDWSGKDSVSVGSIVYDDVSGKVVWNIGRLPSLIDEINANFNISVTPQEEDEGKIMILMPGTEVSAKDKVTEEKLEYNTKAKTTKLSDDEIAEGDGVVE